MTVVNFKHIDFVVLLFNTQISTDSIWLLSVLCSVFKSNRKNVFFEIILEQNNKYNRYFKWRSSDRHRFPFLILEIKQLP